MNLLSAVLKLVELIFSIYFIEISNITSKSLYIIDQE